MNEIWLGLVVLLSVRVFTLSFLSLALSCLFCCLSLSLSVNTSLVGGMLNGLPEGSASLTERMVERPSSGGGLVMGGKTACFVSLTESLAAADAMLTPTVLPRTNSTRTRTIYDMLNVHIQLCDV